MLIFTKNMLRNLVGNRVVPVRLRIEQCDLFRSGLLMALLIGLRLRHGGV